MPYPYHLGQDAKTQSRRRCRPFIYHVIVIQGLRNFFVPAERCRKEHKVKFPARWRIGFECIASYPGAFIRPVSRQNRISFNLLSAFAGMGLRGDLLGDTDFILFNPSYALDIVFKLQYGLANVCIHTCPGSVLPLMWQKRRDTAKASFDEMYTMGEQPCPF